MTIAQEMARGRKRAVERDEFYRKSREEYLQKRGTKGYSLECQMAGMTPTQLYEHKKQLELKRRNSLTDEERLNEDIEKYIRSINRTVISPRGYYNHENSIKEAMTLLCQVHSDENARKLLGIQELYLQKYALLDHQKHMQSLLPDHVVEIDPDRTHLRVSEGLKEAKELLRYYGYKYTNKYGCVRQTGKHGGFGRLYDIPKKIADDLLAKVKGLEVVAKDKGHVVLWSPKCYEDKMREILGYHGVRGFYRKNRRNGIKDEWVNPFVRTKTRSIR